MPKLASSGVPQLHVLPRHRPAISRELLRFPCKAAVRPAASLNKATELFDLGSANGRAELSRRVGKVFGYPPLSELDDLQRREFHEALLEADTFAELPGNWQASHSGR
jgi:hypothetical protein